MSANQQVFGLALGAVALLGCTRNLCEVDSSDPRCAVPPSATTTALTAMPPRISLRSGGAVTVMVKPAPPDGSMVVLRRQNAKDLVFGAVTGGQVTASLKPMDLTAHSFTPGAAQLVLLQDGQPEVMTPVRLYIEPQFTQPAKVYDTSPSTDNPIWIAINKAKTIYTLNQFPPFPGSPDRQLRLGEFQLMNNALAPRVPPTFGAYRAYPFTTLPPGLATLDDTAIVVLSKNPVSANNPVLPDRCLFSTAQCQSLNPMSIEFKSIVGLASDRQGSLFAVQTDLGTLAYRGSDMNPFAEKLVIDSANRPPAGSVVAMASGDLDGDGQSDVIVFESGPVAVSVFLRQPDGKQLRYSPPRSTQLQSLLGGKAPTAAAAADMDADGLDDLLIARDGAVVLLFNQGDGSLATAMPIAALPAADSLAVGAIDPAATGAKLDIAVASSGGQRIAVLLNQATY